MKPILLLLSVLATGLAPAAVNDVTSQMENLGIPLAQRFADNGWGGSGAYARNVWALKAFDGRLYVGAGNSSNGGPASNAGPVPVVSFDPKTKKFATEWNVPDEQIDIFHVFSDGAIYIPGHDPKEDWSLGNFYRRAKGRDAKWEKVRTLKDGVHCYDMEEFDGRLFACGYGTYESSDLGKTFEHTRGPRLYAFFRFPKALYAIAGSRPAGEGSFKDKKGREHRFKRPEFVGVYRRAAGGSFALVKDLKITDLFPDTPEALAEEMKGVRPATVGDRLLYVGGLVHNDHQIQPVGLYLATDGANAFKPERVKLPAGAVPWYTMNVGKKAYVLFATPDGKKGKFRNHVWETTNGKTFAELLVFDTPTFARSMEYLDGCLYFGLGTEVKEHGHFEGNSLKLKYAADEVDRNAGTLLRYRKVLK